MHRIALASLASILLSACSGGGHLSTDGGHDAGTDAGTTDAGNDAGTDAGPGLRALTSIDPATGALSGGTAVALRGQGFDASLSVSLGGAACTGLAVVSATRASCTTPAGQAEGAVDVVATWGDGHTETLAGGFTYTTTPPMQIGFTQITGPSTDPSVAPASTVTVSAVVYVQGVTNGAGQGAGIVAQAGFGDASLDPSASPSQFAWVPIGYTGDADGVTPGDLANDAYGQDLTAPATAGSYRLAVRFSADGQTTWQYADRTGSTDGFAATDLPTVTVAAQTGIDYCHIQFPGTLTAAPGATAGPVYGWVYVAGVTDAAGQGAGIEGALGVGATGTDPSTDASWTWTSATYNTDAGTGSPLPNDEYMASFTAPQTAGTYDYAYRFSRDGGQTWTYCDLASSGGSSDGYQPAGAGKLTVQPSTQPVDYCHLQYPATITAAPSSTAGPVYGWVYLAGVTDSAGQGAGITGEVGVGATGTDPSSDASWTWTSATYNTDKPNSGGQLANDEYQASFTTPATDGSYDYAYRFSADNGQSWTYCDLATSGGSSDGYQSSGAGKLTVQTLPPTKAVDYCHVQYPATLDAEPGQQTGPVYGWVYVANVTDGAGQGAGIQGDVGVGTSGTDPSTDPSWTWTSAVYNTDKPNGSGQLNNDEYMATFTAPATAGGYDYAYRFTADAGQSYTYCDLATSGGSSNGYQTSGAGKLTVVASSIDYCELTGPLTASTSSGSSAGLISGQVYLAGTTGPSGSGTPTIEGELGVGPDGSDPATDASWTWNTATLSTTVGNNDEYQADLIGPATAGSYDYAYRFRVTGAAVWTYCDAPGSPGGSTDGYSPANAGSLTVQ